MILHILLSSAGVGLAVFTLARILPNEKLAAWGFALGKAASKMGAGKMGKKSWEMVENFLENSSGVFLSGVKRGLDADDEKIEETKNA